MAAPSVRLPFAWLGRHRLTIGLASVLVAGAFFRFYQLDSLPPGLSEGSAQLGLQALGLADKGTLPGLSAASGYAPLFVWLQALSIKVLGHTELALRVWPALLGTLAVFTTWLWARAWFGVRIGWLTAFLMAVTPWAVTLSRADIATAIFPLLVTLTLWAALRAWQVNSARRYAMLGAALTLDLLCGPLGWILAATTGIVGAVLLARTKRLMVMNRARAAGAAALGVGLAGLAYLLGTSFPALKDLPQVFGFTGDLAVLGSNLVKTLLMFNVRGDENYRHNLAGEPLLNIFVGIMLIAGFLVGISRLHERRYRVHFIYFITLLVPAAATTTGVPNAARAVAVLPLVLAFAAIGISYLLDLWHTTFPINSAARTTGQAAVVVLLILSLYQGYTQYFRAWAGQSQVYAAYNEGAAQLARHLQTDVKAETKSGKSFTGQRYVVAAESELPVVAYLVHKDATYQPLVARELATLPVAATPRKFLITAAARNEAVKILKVKFPGGVLRPHYSPFNQAEIYYSYEVAK